MRSWICDCFVKACSDFCISVRMDWLEPLCFIYLSPFEYLDAYSTQIRSKEKLRLMWLLTLSLSQIKFIPLSPAVFRHCPFLFSSSDMHGCITKLAACKSLKRKLIFAVTDFSVLSRYFLKLSAEALLILKTGNKCNSITISYIFQPQNLIWYLKRLAGLFWHLHSVICLPHHHFLGGHIYFWQQHVCWCVAWFEGVLCIVTVIGATSHRCTVSACMWTHARTDEISMVIQSLPSHLGDTINNSTVSLWQQRSFLKYMHTNTDIHSVHICSVTHGWSYLSQLIC